MTTSKKLVRYEYLKNLILQDTKLVIALIRDANHPMSAKLHEMNELRIELEGYEHK